MVLARRRQGSGFPFEHARCRGGGIDHGFLTFAKEDLLDHEYIPVGPLLPLRLLTGSPSGKP